MKVLHISGGGLGGGASRGAYWLHKGLLSLDVDSEFLSQYGPLTEDSQNLRIYSDGFFRSVESFTKEWLDRFLVLRNLKRKRVLFSPALYGVDITKLKEYQEADIIHLHWVNNGFLSLDFFRKCNKKIVWTMRDSWPLTGGCHVFYDCEKFLSECRACPILGSVSETDLSNKVWNKKYSVYSRADMTIVSSSSWLHGLVNSSPLVGSLRKELIFNGIDTDSFRPFDSKKCRIELGLNSNSFIVICGARSIDIDKNKGLVDIIKALSFLKTEGGLDNIELVVFGTEKIKKEVISGLDVNYVGHINSDEQLSKYYSASDLFVSASRQESFGKTLVEAMVCGLPVVSYDITGPADIVLHGITGYLAKHYKIESLVEFIGLILRDKEKRISMGKVSRSRALEEFSSIISARSYKELYIDILNK